VQIWYSVADLDAARRFYTERLRFDEIYVDEGDRWARLERDGIEIGLAEGEDEPGREREDEPVAAVVVEDVKAEAERLRADGVDVGVVLEIGGAIRLLDVFDPDGNRLQLTQDM
jgi:catechol 2,3-dioxygenase-like lactoylglutathione lyase family enzyme